MEGKSNVRKGEEVVEVAVAATVAALLMSVVKQLLHCMFRRLVAPSPFLFLLVHVVIASIVFSTFYIPSRPRVISCSSHDSRVDDKNRDRERIGAARGSEEGGAGADDEVNAKADAFIAAFRRRLVLDSIASGECYRRHSFRALDEVLFCFSRFLVWF